MDDQPLEYFLPNSLSAWAVWLSTILFGFILFYSTWFYSFLQSTQSPYNSFYQASHSGEEKTITVEYPSDVDKITSQFIYIQSLEVSNEKQETSDESQAASGEDSITITLNVVNAMNQKIDKSFVEFQNKDQHLNCKNKELSDKCNLTIPTEGRLYFDFQIPKTDEETYITLKIEDFNWITADANCPTNKNDGKYVFGDEYLCMKFDEKYSLNEAVARLINTPPWDNIILVILSLFIVNIAERTVVTFPIFRKKKSSSTCHCRFTKGEETSPDISDIDNSPTILFTGSIWLLSMIGWLIIAGLITIFTRYECHIVIMFVLITGLVIAYEFGRILITNCCTTNSTVSKKLCFIFIGIAFIWLAATITVFLIYRENDPTSNKLIVIANILLLVILVAEIVWCFKCKSVPLKTTTIAATSSSTSSISQEISSQSPEPPDDNDQNAKSTETQDQDDSSAASSTEEQPQPPDEKGTSIPTLGKKEPPKDPDTDPDDPK